MRSNHCPTHIFLEFHPSPPLRKLKEALLTLSLLLRHKVENGEISDYLIEKVYNISKG